MVASLMQWGPATIIPGVQRVTLIQREAASGWVLGRCEPSLYLQGPTAPSFLSENSDGVEGKREPAARQRSIPTITRRFQLHCCISSTFYPDNLEVVLNLQSCSNSSKELKVHSWFSPSRCKYGVSMTVTSRQTFKDS